VYRDEAEKEVDKLLRLGIIRESKSDWRSPIVVSKKKDGTCRVCVDYRRLNEVTKKDEYPLPRMDEILDSLGGSRIFSSFDLLSGYHQVPVREEDVEKTAFFVPGGHYEYLFMPFGLTNAPATF
jgi:hypothetical protein